MKLILDGNSLTISDVVNASAKNSKLAITSKSRIAIKNSRSLIEKWLKNNDVIYGVTTGFGVFSTIRIPIEKIDELQKFNYQSLCRCWRATAKRNCSCDDYFKSQFTCKRIFWCTKYFNRFNLKIFNANLTPLIPSQGSVGSSGDLVQLSHIVLAMLGRGEIILPNGKIVPSKIALKKFNLKPITLSAKEGLALINGTQMMTAYATHIAHRALKLLKLCDIAAALSVEALKGTDTAFDERIHKLRPYKGQIDCAENLRRLLKGSEIRESHRHNDERVQDAYSLRCVPQVHGASRDAINYLVEVCKIEINSANDNPLIFAKDKIHLEGGNFHGQPLALALDFAAIALSELANISERRIDKLVNGSLNELPKFLTTHAGLHSGLMIAQYTAASIVSENKVLAHPASVDSIPTSAGQEDHNSMGSISAQKCWRILHNAENVLAIELLSAAQAIDFHNPLKCGKGTDAAYKTLRATLKHIDKDRLLQTEIKKSYSLLRSGLIEKSVERAIGKLK